MKLTYNDAADVYIPDLAPRAIHCRDSVARTVQGEGNRCALRIDSGSGNADTRRPAVAALDLTPAKRR